MRLLVGTAACDGSAEAAALQRRSREYMQECLERGNMERDEERHLGLRLERWAERERCLAETLARRAERHAAQRAERGYDSDDDPQYRDIE